LLYIRHESTFACSRNRLTFSVFKVRTQVLVSLCVGGNFDSEGSEACLMISIGRIETLGRYSSKNTISYHRQLDIRYLRRKGMLRPGGWASLTWSRTDKVIGSISIRTELDRIVLRYRHRDHDEDWKDEEYPVFLDSTRCNYGGERFWFLCPARGCSRRVAVLYSGSTFACRHCYRLVYDSQREQPSSRALSRAQAIKEKLGGSPADDFPDKPKGMHWRTYNRLCEEFEEAESLSWPPWLINHILRNDALRR
jgi:hypothetical protein